MNQQVFVSYSRKDERFAMSLVQALQKKEIDAWIDTKKIQGGDEWRNSIFQGIKQADVLIVCLSPDAVESPWVRREILVARIHEKRVVPIMVEDCFNLLAKYDETEWLDDLQIIDVKSDSRKAFSSILEAVGYKDSIVEQDSSRGLRNPDWTTLLRRIRDERCTPFVGPGVCRTAQSSKHEMARQWARKHKYPFHNDTDLAQVAQYLAVKFHSTFPNEELVEQWHKTLERPDFRKPDEPHRVLAELPFPIYITSNYDSFLSQALRIHNRSPLQEICQWNELLDDYPSIFETESDHQPSQSNPIVFHLHGHSRIPESLVISEDDYLKFLVNVSKDQNRLPARIQQALTQNALLFIGYRIDDWDFRVLLRCIDAFLERSAGVPHIAVQLVPGEEHIPQEQKARAKEYLKNYFKKLEILVYWGECHEFAAELRSRWDAFQNG